MPAIDLSILNQRQTPAFYADVFANRPAAGFVGRIFVSTDTFAFYRDNGTGWDLIGGPGTGTVTGSGAAGQVAFWSGASLISGENNLWWDSANNHLGINTNTPATALDVNHNGTLVAKFNNTTSANSLIAFENAGNEQWWIGTENTNNDFLFYDATNFPTLSLRTTFKTNGQVLIGGGSTGSGRLVVESATSDNGIQIVGANAPSLRIDSAATGPTKRIGLGISTATNNFIQGSADRDMCIFNGSTTASPILFGIYDAGALNVQEAARISPARNFLIGTTTDNGSKLNVNGVINAAGRINSGSGGGATASLNAQQLSSDDAAIYAGGVVTTGSSKGIKVLAGTNSSDYALSVSSYANLPILYANGAGMVGIGTPSPETRLQVFDNGAGAFTVLRLQNRAARAAGVGVRINLQPNSDFGNADTGAAISAVNSGGGFQNNTELIFETSSLGTGSEAMRITSGRNLLIGTTTDAGQKLQVNGTALAVGYENSGQLAFLLNNSGINNDFRMGSSSSQFRLVNNTNTAALMTVNNSGSTSFSGSVDIGNPVTAAIGIASTHKVSILINGVQYYLLASNV